MSLLALLLCSTWDRYDKCDGSKPVVRGVTFGTLAVLAVLALLGLSVYLAVQDMAMLDRTSTKVWVFLLAALLPELYVVLHGISSSSTGRGFFEASPIEGAGAFRAPSLGSGGWGEAAPPTPSDAATLTATASPSSLLGL